MPLQLAFALALALVLDRGLRGLAFYRSVYYLPSLLGGSVAIAILWRQIFGSDGLVNQFLAPVRHRRARAGCPTPTTALWTLILLHVWTFGAPMVIFLAGLRQIPHELLRGGRGRRRRPVAAVPLDHAAAAHPDHLLQPGAADDQRRSSPSPRRSSSAAAAAAGRLDPVLHAVPLPARASSSFDMGYASAMAWVLLLIIAGLHRRQLPRVSSTGCSMATTTVSAVTAPLYRRRPRAPSPASSTCLLIGFGLVMLYPLLWMVSSSLKPEELIFREPGLCPERRCTLEQLHRRAGTRSTHSFGYYLWNSAVIALPGGRRQPVSCSLAAYAFARLEFPAEEAVVRDHARHDHAADPRHDRPAVHPVRQARLDQHLSGR